MARHRRLSRGRHTFGSAPIRRFRHGSCPSRGGHNFERILRLASLCYGALQLSGLTTLMRRISRGGVVLCYHNVVGGNDGGHLPHATLGLHIPLPTFERQMRWLVRHYTVVPLADLVTALLHGRSLRRTVALTFDDAYAGVFDNALPLLHDLGIPATVFVVAEAPGRDEGFWWDDPRVLRSYSPAQRQRWLTVYRGDRAQIAQALAGEPHSWQPPAWCKPAPWHAIRQAADAGVDLGAHSATHRSLPALDDRDLRQEIAGSREIIKGRTGVTPEFFTYPYGLWNERVRQTVRAAGYRAAFTLAEAHPAATIDAWTIPRVNVPAGIEDSAFQAWTAGINLQRWRGA